MKKLKLEIIPISHNKLPKDYAEKFNFTFKTLKFYKIKLISEIGEEFSIYAHERVDIYNIIQAAKKGFNLI